MQLSYADCGRVRATTIIKGTDKFMPVTLAKQVDVVQLEYLLAEVDNIILVCKKHIDDTNYIFKLELREEREKDPPKITVQRWGNLNNEVPSYIFHITPDMTKFIEPGKYWYSISFEINGSIFEFDSNVLTIKPSIIDASGGQIIQSESLMDLDHYTF